MLTPNYFRHYRSKPLDCRVQKLLFVAAVAEQHRRFAQNGNAIVSRLQVLEIKLAQMAVHSLLEPSKQWESIFLILLSISWITL